MVAWGFAVVPEGWAAAVLAVGGLAIAAGVDAASEGRGGALNAGCVGGGESIVGGALHPG